MEFKKGMLVVKIGTKYSLDIKQGTVALITNVSDDNLVEIGGLTWEIHPNFGEEDDELDRLFAPAGFKYYIQKLNN